MRIRFRWIVVLALLAGVSWRNHEHWRESASEWLLDLRAQRFRADAKPTTTYRVPRDDWVSFRLATNTTWVRVSTTAALRQKPSLDRLQHPRWSGWRYALEYEVLAADGSVLRHDEYHFRADLKQYRQPETSELFTASFFGDSFRVPVQTRSLQLRLDDLEQVASGLRLRLLDHEPEIGEVVARVLCRRPRPGYKKSNTWSRLSKRRRERLCRAGVYPPDLLTPREREKLLRWEWTPGAPVGIADVDFLRRRMYTIEEIVGDEIGDEILPAGNLVERERRATVPVPEGAGVATLEIECVERPDNEPLQVEASWFGLGALGPTIRRLTICRPVESVSMPVEGGLIELATNGRVVVRSAWRPDEGGGAPRPRAQEEHAAIENAATPIDITPEPQILLTCVADEDQTIAYSLCHRDGQPTPFCVTLRSIGHGDVRTPPGSVTVRQPPGPPYPPTHWTDQPSAGVRVKWTLLDKHGSPIDTGPLQADESISNYDRIRVARDSIPVSEPAAFYFLVPADAASIEFAAETPVLLAAYTRPPGLAKRTQVPEDYHPYHRERSLRRSWFFLRPQAYSKLVAEGRTLAVHLQPRPPQRNEDLLAGHYLWEDFRPTGFWKGRHLLVPRETHMPLRDEALPSTHWEFPVNREHQVRFATNPGCRTVQSRLIYVTEQPATLSLRLDDNVWMTTNLRSSCGEIELPPRLADPAWHRLVIQADKPVRVFLRNVRSESAPRFLKRLAPTIVDGRLRFSVTKRSEDEELLMLRLYQTANQAARVPLRVRLQTAGRRIPGPTRSWTLTDRIFDLRRDAASPTLVLGSKATVDTGRVCYVSLGADMPPGLYSVDVERLGESESDEYVLLYRTVPGVTARRRVYVEESPIRGWVKESNSEQVE